MSSAFSHFDAVSIWRQPPFRRGLKPRGLGASSPQGAAMARRTRERFAQEAAFHVSIRPRARGTVPTMSHPSGGSRRATALLSGATPTHANGTSACDARCNL